jgi:hypothetical protein
MINAVNESFDSFSWPPNTAHSTPSKTTAVAGNRHTHSLCTPGGIGEDNEFQARSPFASTSALCTCCHPSSARNTQDDSSFTNGQVATDPSNALTTNSSHDLDFEFAVFQNIQSQQRCFMAAVDYMSRQFDITEQMRAILVDWLVEVSDEYDFKSSTLFLTISVIDRLLSVVQAKRNKLQLVGMTAMVIAAKNQEYSSPELEDFVHISDNAYSKRELMHMEGQILTLLEFKINAPTTATFLHRFQAIAKIDEEAIQLSNYLAELSLLEYAFLRYEPSKIAASVIALSLHTLGCVPWTPTLQAISSYQLRDLEECMERLLHIYHTAGTMQLVSVYEKYLAPNPYLAAATIPPPPSIPTQ